MKRQIITIVSLLLNVAVHLRRDWRTSGVSFTQIAPLLACHSKKINCDISTNLKMYHLFLQRTVLTGSKQKYTCASVMCFGGLCISDVLWGAVHQWCALGGCASVMCFGGAVHQWCALGGCASVMCFGGLCISDVLWGAVHQWCALGGCASVMCFGGGWMGVWLFQCVRNCKKVLTRS